MTSNTKRALITGGTKGIGRAVAEALLAEGTAVGIVARNAEDIGTWVETQQAAGYSVWGLSEDLTDPAAPARIHAAVADRWPALDILVNNAGTNLRKSFVEYTPEEYARIFQLNLFAAMELSRQLHPLLRLGKGASVVNLTSIAGALDVNSGPPYGVTKAGLAQLTRHLAVEWAADGIRVNAVAPWYIRTPLTEPVLNNPERYAAILKRTPLGRVGEPEEVAALVVFLASDRASYITGQQIFVDGGMSCQGLQAGSRD